MSEHQIENGTVGGHQLEVRNDEYLGDGLFAKFDGFQFEVYASNGMCKTNVVYMEPSVVTAFFDYVARVRKGQL